MFKLFSIFVFLLFAQFKPVSANEQADQRWQYRWSESEPWKAVTSPCSPPNREDRDLLFLKLIRTHTETNSILIKDHSFSFELVNNNVVTNYPNGRKGYLAGYKDFIVNIGSQSEMQFRTRSDAKNHIGFCKGFF